MAPKPNVLKAFKAMAVLGISEKQVKPALKHLLMVFDKNWALIEAENYRALIDAIFESPEAQVVEEKKKPNDEEDMEEEPQLHREPASLKRSPRGHESSSQKKKSTNTDVENDTEEESLLPHQNGRPFKRLRKTHEGQISPSPDACNPMLSGTSLIRPKVETDELPGTCSPQQALDIRRSPESRAELQRPVSPHLGNKNKGKQLVVSKLLAPQERSEQLSLQAASQVERSSMGVRFKEKIVEPGIILLPKKNVFAHQLREPKDEPFTDDMAQDEVPIAVILPDPSSKENPVLQNGGTGEQNDQEPMASKGREHNGILASSSERNPNFELANTEEESPSNLEVASSPLGEVKLSFSCTPAIARPDFHMPNLDAVLKLTEEKCLHSYKITDPNFSLKKLLGHMCKSFLELGTNANSESQDGSISISPSLDTLRKSTALDAVGRTKETLRMQSRSSNGTVTIECPSVVSTPHVPRLPLSLNGAGNCREPLGMTDSNGFAEVDKGGECENSHALVVGQQSDLTPDELRSYHDMDDITRGEEKVSITWVNDLNSECPPGFYYINKSLIFRDADVHFCLTDIGDGNCCGTCFGNCLSMSAGCACASQTGGEFAYTPEGLVKEDFLEECISVTHNPQHRSFYCKSCPLERVKDDDCFEPCKGHLRRKFIKECWKKCGCNRQCGNRVVQRGLNCKLQVFYTSEGKGWGLRTLEELPKGAFVCEYAGEVLTSEELHERNIKSAISGKRPYPVLLDANWSSKADMRNEEALSLDATNYGNVAKFINHRCLDANLVGIPVEVEMPGRYYYHLAFFTTRKIDALEELNRDYGIDFDDHDHPVKVFQCKCGSKFCRNMKRPNRSRPTSIAN